MKIVLTYGTFDLFHVGHVRLLKRLKNFGDKLFVGLSSDEFNNIKGKKSFFSYAEREEILNSCKYVDFVFPEYCWEQKKEDILKYDVDIFAMGDDWTGKFDELNELNEQIEVIYLPRTSDISTTDIKNSLSKINNNDLTKIKSSLDDIFEIIQSISQK